MYDTIVASTNHHIVDKSIFDQRSVADGVVRMWRNPRLKYEPRLTYWLREGEQVGRLRVEFSIPKMLGFEFENPTTEQAYEALERVNVFLGQIMRMPLPVAEWSCQRIDYAWNFKPSDDVAKYITMLQGLFLGRMSRHSHPDAEGVVWKSRQPNYRWVKFYNKAREAGSNGTPVLRFEVSNYRKSLAYMCSKWFACEQTVGALVQPGRALYVMARVWSQLGLFASTYHVDNGLLLKLHDLFGGRAAKAFYALMCISTYGADAHKRYALLSDNTYYTWKRLLSEHDLLVNSDVYVAPLSLPVADVLKDIQKGSAQDLRKGSSAAVVPSSKNSWVFWAKLLKLHEKSPEILRLIPVLEAAYVGFGGVRQEAGRTKPANVA